MANSTTTAVVYLDTFGAGVDIGNKNVFSIEWVQPSTVGHTCTILQDGVPFIEWTCAVQHKGYIKYCGGKHLRNLTVATDAVQSGQVIIHIA